MDSASPIARRVAAQTTDSQESVAFTSEALSFFALTHKPAEFGNFGANASFSENGNPIADANAVPPRYRYRRSDCPRPTGYGRPA